MTYFYRARVTMAPSPPTPPDLLLVPQSSRPICCGNNSKIIGWHSTLGIGGPSPVKSGIRHWALFRVPLSPTCSQFHAIFWKIWQRVGAPSYGESWTRLCIEYLEGNK